MAGLYETALETPAGDLVNTSSPLSMGHGCAQMILFVPSMTEPRA
jgi:hypothetical protein